MKISIIIPFYNICQYIYQCLESVLVQTYNSIELILIDDGSGDFSGEICDNLLTKNINTIVIHQVNNGVSSARNISLDLATGEYVAFVDGDDWLDAQMVQSLMFRLRQDSSIDLLMFSYKKEYANSSVVRHIYYGDVFLEREQEVKAQLYRKLFGLLNDELDKPESLDYLSTCWGKIYKRELLAHARFVSIKEIGSGEDGLFNIFALEDCKRAMYIDEPFYHYRKTAGSLTSKFRPHMIEEWGRLFGYMQDVIDAKGLSPDYQEALNNRIALSILGVGLNGFDNPASTFIGVVKYINRYLKSKNYKNAILTMRLRKLPLPWKVLMICSKCRFGLGVAVILQALRVLKSKL